MTAQQIINDVADHYGITPGQLIHGDKHRIYADPRHVAAYLLHEQLGLNYCAIGRIFNKRHATIIYAVQKVNAWVNMPRLNQQAVNYINNMKI